MTKGIHDPGGRVPDVERARRSRKNREFRAALPSAGPRQPVVDSAVGSPALWDPEALKIARVILANNEHLRSPRWADQLMSYAHFEAGLREDRVILAAMDKVKARTEVLLYEETTEGMPSSGLVKRHSEAQKVLAMDQQVMDKERLTLTMRRELGITPASWARMRAEMERKKDFDFALFVVEDEADAG